MNIIDAIGVLHEWPEEKRREVFDVECFALDPDGERVDTWCEAAVGLLDLCGRVELCDTPAEIETALRECVASYVESEIIPIARVRDHALKIIAKLLAWGDAAVCN